MRRYSCLSAIAGCFFILMFTVEAFERGGFGLFVWFVMAALFAACLFSPSAELPKSPPTRVKTVVRKEMPGMTQSRSTHRPTAPLVPVAFSAGNPAAIDLALNALPPRLLGRSGSVFYTGREAFIGRQPLYLLGLNPGGDPVLQSRETIERALADYRNRNVPWSAYADDSWQGTVPGTCGMQPRVLHMLRQLGLDPRLVAASNVVFVRSRNEAVLREEKGELLKSCWPVHQAVIDSMGVNAVLCFGGTAGKWVREQLKAHNLIDDFRERNARGWKSEAHQAANGRVVITLTHPSRADWRNAAADPTPLIKRVLSR